MNIKEAVEQFEVDFWQTMGANVSTALAEVIEERGGTTCSEDVMAAFEEALRRVTADYSKAVGVAIDLDMIESSDGAPLQ